MTKQDPSIFITRGKIDLNAPVVDVDPDVLFMMMCAMADVLEREAETRFVPTDLRISYASAALDKLATQLAAERRATG